MGGILCCSLGAIVCRGVLLEECVGVGGSGGVVVPLCVSVWVGAECVVLVWLRVVVLGGCSVRGRR
jgi:hypothetical protein